MRYIICYDITDAKLRRQIVKVCEAYGQRAQRSVFEGNLDTEKLRELKQQLEEEMRSEKRKPNDSVRIYPLCTVCSQKTFVLGYKTNLLTEHETIVIGGDF